MTQGPIRRPFLLIFLALPFVEIVGFVVIGGQIGLLATLAWTFASILIGIALVRREGFAVLLKADEVSRRRQNAAPEIIEGALVALAGVLLIVPGFVSDAAGLLLFLRPVRTRIAARLAARMKAEARAYGPAQGPAGAEEVVDLDPEDWREVEPREDDTSPWRLR